MLDDFLRDDDGVITIEYVIGTLVAATMALVLLAVIKNKSVSELMRSFIEDALAV